MKIGSKVLMVVLPLLIFPLLLIGFTSFLSARSGITKVAEEFLKYKTTELYKYCRRQEDILLDTGLAAVEDYRNLARKSAEEYAETIRLSDTGYFMAVNSAGRVVFPAGDSGDLSGSDFFKTMTQQKIGLIDFSYREADRVGYFMYFEPWDWYILLSEQQTIFYQDAENIKKQVAITIATTIFAAVALILFFIKKLTNPVGNVVSTMKEIITSNDLSKRVRIEYDDEIGHMALWFNRMIEDLELAYNQIKQYAYKSVLAQKNEERIRHIFQKYVPAEIIDEVLKLGADKLLIGKKQVATILFSDIRGFTAISEKLTAEQVVNSLNTYFNVMVSIIIEYKGIIDKFIGDAIMAIFGAPVIHPDDPYMAIMTGLKMIDALQSFNKKQAAEGKPNFRVGIGLNTGEVVIGNIGSTQKLDYTCIGDTVNLASRLEGLTKLYQVPIIISEYTYNEAKNGIKARELDAVRVAGKLKPVRIYQPYGETMSSVREGYDIFKEGISKYRNRFFEQAEKLFKQSYEILKSDTPSLMYIDRCRELLKEPPGESWDGVYTAKTK